MWSPPATPLAAPVLVPGDDVAPMLHLQHQIVSCPQRILLHEGSLRLCRISLWRCLRVWRLCPAFRLCLFLVPLRIRILRLCLDPRLCRPHRLRLLLKILNVLSDKEAAVVEAAALVAAEATSSPSEEPAHAQPVQILHNHRSNVVHVAGECRPSSPRTLCSGTL